VSDWRSDVWYADWEGRGRETLQKGRKRNRGWKNRGGALAPGAARGRPERGRAPSSKNAGGEARRRTAGQQDAEMCERGSAGVEGRRSGEGRGRAGNGGGGKGLGCSALAIGQLETGGARGRGKAVQDPETGSLGSLQTCEGQPGSGRRGWISVAGRFIIAATSP